MIELYLLVAIWGNPQPIGVFYTKQECIREAQKVQKEQPYLKFYCGAFNAERVPKKSLDTRSEK